MVGTNLERAGDEKVGHPTSHLARRNLIAVRPVAGWWKTNTVLDPQDLVARFLLIVEIDASESNAEPYAEV